MTVSIANTIFLKSFLSINVLRSLLKNAMLSDIASWILGNLGVQESDPQALGRQSGTPFQLASDILSALPG